jgi:hypothetical protein
MEKKCLVIFYDGSEYQVKEYKTNLFDSSQPHVYGLPDEFSVIAVITDHGKEACVYIEEVLVHGEGV